MSDQRVKIDARTALVLTRSASRLTRVVQGPSRNGTGFYAKAVSLGSKWSGPTPEQRSSFAPSPSKVPPKIAGSPGACLYSELLSPKHPSADQHAGLSGQRVRARALHVQDLVSGVPEPTGASILTRSRVNFASHERVGPSASHGGRVCALETRPDGEQSRIRFERVIFDALGSRKPWLSRTEELA